MKKVPSIISPSSFCELISHFSWSVPPLLSKNPVMYICTMGYKCSSVPVPESWHNHWMNMKLHLKQMWCFNSLFVGLQCDTRLYNSYQSYNMKIEYRGPICSRLAGYVKVIYLDLMTQWPPAWTVVLSSGTVLTFKCYDRLNYHAFELIYYFLR